MSDIKLFRTLSGSVAELPSQSVQIEKSLQTLFEQNLEGLLGIRFLASEYSTGPVHGGRIDTLGLDENDSPVIIEYKRAVVENVINQGLFYLDWLLDHRKEFQWLVMEKLGSEAATAVDWSSPRLVCIASDFTRYDGHAVKQINRNIELLRYRKFGDEFLMIEQAHSARAAKPSPRSAPTPAIKGDAPAASAKDPYASQHIAYRIANASPELRDLYEEVSAYLTALGDDVQVKETKTYIAFKRIKNFVCVEVYPQTKVVTCFLKVNPDSVTLEPSFTRDVRRIGHFGTGDLEVLIRSRDDFVKAQPLFQRAYDQG